MQHSKNELTTILNDAFRLMHPAPVTYSPGILTWEAEETLLSLKLLEAVGLSADYCGDPEEVERHERGRMTVKDRLVHWRIAYTRGSATQDTPIDPSNSTGAFSVRCLKMWLDGEEEPELAKKRATP